MDDGEGCARVVEVGWLVGWLVGWGSSMGDATGSG